MLTHVLSVSGGKDSTAAGLHLRELGIPFRAVFFDTGWEAPETYRYLRDVVPEALGVEVSWHRRLPELDDRREQMARDVEAVLGLESALGPESAMVRWSLKKGFPSRVRRWCTEQMKVLACRDVMNAAIEAGGAPVNVVGVRAEESAARAKLPERELGSFSAVWRPILRWTLQDVIDIHARHDVIPNPLYLREHGARRVGCWPCVQCSKAELRLLAADDRRIRALELLEQHVTTLAHERAAAKGRPLLRPPAFFQGERRDRVVEPCPECGGACERDGEVCDRCEGQGSVRFIPTIPIRKMLEWARTAYGGRQMLLGLPSRDGCLAWGLCDLPMPQPEED